MGDPPPKTGTGPREERGQHRGAGKAGAGTVRGPRGGSPAGAMPSVPEDSWAPGPRAGEDEAAPCAVTRAGSARGLGQRESAEPSSAPTRSQHSGPGGHAWTSHLTPGPGPGRGAWDQPPPGACRGVGVRTFPSASLAGPPGALALVPVCQWLSGQRYSCDHHSRATHPSFVSDEDVGVGAEGRQGSVNPRCLGLCPTLPDLLELRPPREGVRRSVSGVSPQEPRGLRGSLQQRPLPEPLVPPCAAPCRCVHTQTTHGHGPLHRRVCTPHTHPGGHAARGCVLTLPPGPATE